MKLETLEKANQLQCEINNIKNVIERMGNSSFRRDYASDILPAELLKQEQATRLMYLKVCLAEARKEFDDL